MKNQKLISRKIMLEEFPVERGINGEYYFVRPVRGINWSITDYVNPFFYIDRAIEEYKDKGKEERIQNIMSLEEVDRQTAELIESSRPLTGIAPIPGRVGGYRNPVITLNTKAFLAARRPVTTTAIRPTGASPKIVTTTRNYVGETEQAAKIATEKQAERWLNLRDPLSRIRVTTNTSRGILNEPSLEGTMNIGISFKDKVDLFFDKLKRVNSSKIIKTGSGIIGGSTILYSLYSDQRNNNGLNNNLLNNVSLSPWSSNINTNTFLSPWNKAKNPNVKLSPWSTDLNNQLTQKSNNLSNNNLSNIRTSRNIWSSKRPDDGKFTLSRVPSFGESVINYQNSHSTDNDVKFTIPLGDVSINENDLLIRQIIPDIETRYAMPKSSFNITRNPVSSTSTLVSNSNLPHITVPSLADVEYTPRQTTSSTTTTSSSTQEPKLFTVKEKDSESKFNRKDIEDELVFMNLLTKDEAKNKSDEEIASLFLDYINKNVALLDKEPPKLEEKKEETKTSSAPIIMNREDVRNLMRYHGVNPYSYTGNLRKALRKYLNKEDNQLYEDWMAPFVIFKKKGGLISKNSIERFLKGKTIKKVLKIIYNTLADPIHAIFGNPGNQKAPNISNYGGGSFGGGGASGHWENPTYHYNEIHPADTLFMPTTQTFNDAFADARRRGLDTFEFNGGIYGTELGDNPNWKVAGDARIRDTVIPVSIPADTIRKTSDVPRNDTIITNIGYRRYPVSTSNINKIFNK